MKEKISKSSESRVAVVSFFQIFCLSLPVRQLYVQKDQNAFKFDACFDLIWLNEYKIIKVCTELLFDTKICFESNTQIAFLRRICLLA